MIMRQLKILFLSALVFSVIGCSRDNSPPVRLNDCYRDTKRMKRYIKAQGIDKVTLVWSTEGPWSIDLSDSSVINLGWSIGIPIDKIIINNTEVSSLHPLKKQPSLRWLEANNTQVSDLSPLAGIRHLETLEIANTKVSDLAPLRNIEIIDLDIQGIPCADLSDIPLEKLRSIHFSLDPLKEWKGVKRVKAKKNLIVNRFMNNEDFWAEYNRVYSGDNHENGTILERKGE